MPTRNLESVFSNTVLWSQLTNMRKQSRVAQSLLIVAPEGLYLQAFLDRLLTHFLCTQEQAPCGSCSLCQKVLSDNHPDIYMLKPESMGGTIKIEQIRDMQKIASQTPHMSERQIVVIYPAEAMNQAAASALLKILEEPAPSTQFILIAAHADLLLPTIVSRCQIIQVDSHVSNDDILRQGETYPDTSVRALLSNQRFQLLDNLDALLRKHLSVSDVAEKWSEQPTEDMLWFFSCILIKLIHLNLLPNTILGPDYQAYTIFKQNWHPVNLYEQLDNIYAILKQLHRNIN